MSGGDQRQETMIWRQKLTSGENDVATYVAEEEQRFDQNCDTEALLCSLELLVVLLLRNEKSVLLEEQWRDIKTVFLGLVCKITAWVRGEPEHTRKKKLSAFCDRVQQFAIHYKLPAPSLRKHRCCSIQNCDSGI